MDVILVVFKYAWIFFVVVTVVNGLILRSRSKKFIAADPTLEEGYEQLFKGWIVFGNIPWAVMGIGVLSGMTQSMFEYFNPRAMNPAVLAFHASILCLYVMFARWIYLGNGAEFLERHPGLINISKMGKSSYATAKEIRWLTPLMLVGGIVAMVAMWYMDIPIPKF